MLITNDHPQFLGESGIGLFVCFVFNFNIFVFIAYLQAFFLIRKCQQFPPHRIFKLGSLNVPSFKQIEDISPAESQKLVAIPFVAALSEASLVRRTKGIEVLKEPPQAMVLIPEQRG